MALDQFQMPNFRDEDGFVYVWDPTSSSYVKKPASDNRPDISHATGGDNDLFDPFQHTEMSGSPMTEGYMASTQDQPPFASPNQVKCPNCQGVTSEHICPQCQKDLTPEWNTHGQDNEFFGVHPDYNDASEYWSWPQNVPKPTEQNYDNSFPSMSLSHKTAAEEWDDMFGDPAEGAGPAMRTEVGRWISTLDGQIHVGQGNILHEQIEARDGITREQEIACGSVYSDGAADTQAVFHPERFNLEETQQQLQQVFGQIHLSPPIGRNSQEKGTIFQPFAITEGMWFIAPGKGIIAGTAWVKERSNGVQYQPFVSPGRPMILCAEHLRPEDYLLYANGVPAIITATGGAGSHATYLAMTQNIPVVTAIGEAYSKLETGNHVKIDPDRKTIEVMPGEWPREQNQDAWNNILRYRQQQEREDPSLIPQKPMAFAHIIDEENWRLANSPNLESCPECSAPMMDQDGESVCHDCGHKQPIIQAQAKVAAQFGLMYHRYKKANVNALIVTAMVGKKIVGYLTAEPVHNGYVTDYIHVDPEYRRRGIATAMVSKSRQYGTIPYATVPNQVYQSEAGRSLAEKVYASTSHHRQSKVVTSGPAALAAPLLEGGGAAAGAGGGISGIGGIMNSALGRGVAFRAGENLVGGGNGDSSGSGGGLTPTQPAPDPNIGTISHRFASENRRHAGILSTIFESLLNGIKSGQGWANALTHPASPLSYVDDALMGGVGQIQQQIQNVPQQTTSATTFGEEEEGAAAKNDGTNSTDEASDSGIEGKKEQGDGPEQLKDIGGDGGSKDTHSGDNLADPHLQDKALKAFHMNLPLVIEFAESEEPGSENPILVALDQLLEEAFPGYKDGHDQENGATDEHPQEKSEVEEPDAKSEGADKKEAAALASVWHYADLKDYEHWNEEAPRIWWEEEGRHQAEPDYGDPQEDYDHYGREDAAWDEVYEEMKDLDDATLQEIVKGNTSYVSYADKLDQKGIMDMAQEELSNRQSNPVPGDGQQWLGHVPKEASIWHYAWGNPGDGYTEGYEDHPENFSEFDEPLENPECPECGGPGVPLGTLGKKTWFRCRNCGMDFSQHEEPHYFDDDLPPGIDTRGQYWGKTAGYEEDFADYQGGDRSIGDVIAAYPDGTIILDDGITTWNMERAQQFAQIHGWSDTVSAPGVASNPQMEAERGLGRGAKTATLDPNQMMAMPGGGGIPAGAGGPTMQICPRCGQAHPAGTPCPVADVTTPLTTGDPQAQATPSLHVVTKWKLAMPGNIVAPMTQQQAGAPAAPATCPLCHCNHLPGTPCPSYDNTQQPAATGAQPMAPAAAPMISPGVSYSSIDDHFALFDDVSDNEEDTETSRKHNDDHHDNSYEDDNKYHSDDDWVDDSGQPLQEGAEYEMKTAASPIPDRVTIERILPEKLTYVLHSGDIDFRDAITRDQLDLDGTVFSAVNYDDTGEDSMDQFSDEMPVRPGQDALPQQDDLSTPTTTVSRFLTIDEARAAGQEAMDEFEPVSLDNYTGSFQGDKVDTRAWLREESSEVDVDVDPILMSKLAGKVYSPREQREFIDERGEARNLDRLDLQGTHYIDTELHTNDSLW